MKKLLLILLPVILLGAGVALVFTGVVKIPGLNLKGQKKAANLYADDKDPKTADKTDPKKDGAAKNAAAKKDASKVATNETPAKKALPPKPKADVIDTKPELGQKKLAKLWNEMEVASLKDITKDWKEKELAAVLNKMDSAKVAEFLGILDAKRASNLSREMLKQASQVPHETGL